MYERLHPLFELCNSRFREFHREPGAVFWVFGFPVLLALILGLAFRNHEPELPRIAVVEGLPAEMKAALEASEEITLLALSAPAAEEQLRRGGVDLVVSVDDVDAPKEGLEGAEPALGQLGIRYRYDGARAEARVARLQVDAVLQQGLGRTDVLRARDEAVTEAGARYVDYLFPGIIGMNIMGSSMWGIGYSLVMMRRRGQLKRLAATPMRRSDFLVSVFLSRFVFLAMEVVALLGFGSLVFGVSIHGSLPALAALAVMGAAAFAAISLMIAARTESIEAATGWLNFVMLPMWMLSGTFFSYERFPEALHPVLRALPLTALNDGLRSIVNEGTGFGPILWVFGVLSVWIVLPSLFAHRAFRW